MPRLSSDGGKHYCPDALVGHTPITEIEQKAFFRQAQTLVHPTKAGYYDPLSIMCLVDLLLRLDAGDPIRLRPRPVSNLLDVEYPQFSWAPIVVGRILSDLAEAAEVCGAPSDEAPIRRRRIHGGHVYDLVGTRENWRWLADVRRIMGELAERVIREERGIGERVMYDAFPFDAVAKAQWGRETTVAA